MAYGLKKPEPAEKSERTKEELPIGPLRAVVREGKNFLLH